MVFTRIVEELPATVPFVAPDALERRSGRKLRLRLGANESTFGVSPRAREAMIRAVDDTWCYADPENHDLRVRLARLHNVDISNISAGSGIDDLLGLIVRCFVEPGQSVVASLGSYPTFAYHVHAYGGVLHKVPYRDDKNDLDALAGAAARTSARLLFLANPDNPSGSWHTARDIAALLDRLPPGCTLVLDEAYVEFAPADAVIPIDASDTRVIRTRTFSKVHGMAGARIGYALAAAPVVTAFDKVRLHFGVNLVAQVGALASLDDPAFTDNVIAEVARGREEYAALGRELNLPTLPSATNFVLFDIGDNARARALLQLLLSHDTFVRMPGAPPLDRCIRVTVGKPDERAAFAELLRRLKSEQRY